MSINTHQIKYFIKHYFSARRKGHGIHSPLAYRLCEEVFYNQDSFYSFHHLNTIREQFLRSDQSIEVEDFGAGSKHFKNNSRKLKDIAAKGISSRKQSEILFKLANFFKCRNIIELGSSVGLNSLYLAMVSTNTKVISLEGSRNLFDFAAELAKKNKQENIEFINDTFDNALPSVLQNIEKLDLLYVDGNHTEAATLKYFELALKYKQDSSIFIFDDIYWSEGMTKAWEEIKKHPQVTLSIDLFYFGIIFFDTSIKEKIDLKLYI